MITTWINEPELLVPEIISTKPRFMRGLICLFDIYQPVIKAKCGHVVEKKCIDLHDGLCRKCHSNFSFIQDLESKGGEDALVQYWYAMILTKLSGANEQDSTCLIGHLMEFYQKQLVIVPSKERYLRKMLYMLNSLLTPFDVKTLK
jgi:hypothetical protein